MTAPHNQCQPEIASDLVQQLREKAKWREGDVHGNLHEEAADRIEKLEGALRDLFEHEAFSTLEGCDCESCAPVARARALLEPSHD